MILSPPSTYESLVKLLRLRRSLMLRPLCYCNCNVAPYLQPVKGFFAKFITFFSAGWSFG